ILVFFFFSSRRRHTRFSRDWSSDVCSSDLKLIKKPVLELSIPKSLPNTNAWTFLRLIPTFFFLLAMWMVVVALARPQRSNEKVEIGRASCRERAELLVRAVELQE